MQSFKTLNRESPTLTPKEAPNPSKENHSSLIDKEIVILNIEE
jgi:hypothetical protein